MVSVQALSNIASILKTFLFHRIKATGIFFDFFFFVFTFSRRNNINTTVTLTSAGPHTLYQTNYTITKQSIFIETNNNNKTSMTITSNQRLLI